MKRLTTTSQSTHCQKRSWHLECMCVCPITFILQMGKMDRGYLVRGVRVWAEWDSVYGRVEGEQCGVGIWAQSLMVWFRLSRTLHNNGCQCLSKGRRVPIEMCTALYNVGIQVGFRRASTWRVFEAQINFGKGVIDMTDWLYRVRLIT